LRISRPVDRFFDVSNDSAWIVRPSSPFRNGTT
jgi:hypothetical protein